MPIKKKHSGPEVEPTAEPIPEELLDQLVTGPITQTGTNWD